jgi:phosphohistidine phosphatase
VKRTLGALVVKELLLLRHGKSDWNADYGKDRERPLAPRGKAAAKLIGRFLKKTNSVPDLVVTSSALRACSTAQLAAEAGGWSSRLVVTDNLYASSSGTVLKLISRQAKGVERLMLVGHNPTWEDTIRLLIGGGMIRVPTATIACNRFPILSWNDASAGSGVLQWLVTPKLLKKGGVR